MRGEEEGEGGGRLNAERRVGEGLCSHYLLISCIKTLDIKDEWSPPPDLPMPACKLQLKPHSRDRAPARRTKHQHMGS